MGLFDRWFGPGTTDPTVAARQRSAAWGAFLAQQRATLPPRPVDSAPPLATAPMVGAVGVQATPQMTAAPTTVLVIEDGEEDI